MDNEKNTRPNYSGLLKYGPWGIVIALFIYLGPIIKEGYVAKRGEDREDRKVNESVWEGYARRLEKKIDSLEAQVFDLTMIVTKLAEEKEFLAAADANAPIGIIILGKDLRMIKMNQAAYYLWLKGTGLNIADVMAKNWTEMFPGNEQALYYHNQDLEIRRTGKPVFDNGGGYTLMEDGQKVSWSIIKWPIYKGGEFQGIKCVFLPEDKYNYVEQNK